MTEQQFDKAKDLIAHIDDISNTLNSIPVNTFERCAIFLYDNQGRPIATISGERTQDFLEKTFKAYYKLLSMDLKKLKAELASL